MKRIWKLGGSLLTDCDFPERFQALCATVPPAENLVLVGGGQAVDLVRQWQKRFQLNDAQCHDLALAGMSFNAQLVTRLLPGFNIVSPQEICSLESSNDPLPRTWQLTSDSLAAWLCGIWNVSELILVKSVDVRDRTIPELIEDRVVDELFLSFRTNETKIGLTTLKASKMEITWL